MSSRFSNKRFNSFILSVNEIFTKSFSFILFWFLGIQLKGDELSEFLIEMPFIFLFSTVLSFGVSTFFLDQKKRGVETLKGQASFALSFVLLINLIIAVIIGICSYLNIISINFSIVSFITISLNINSILSEYFFSLKKYRLMVFTSLTPKLLFFIGLSIFDSFNFVDKNLVYILMIFSHIICSIHAIFNINFKFTLINIIEYIKFTWLLTLQSLLAYLAYVSFRYFINISDGSSYLIEFSILQTYMGFFALLVSVANRFLIHDLYESLISFSVNKVVSNKFNFFNKLFFLTSFFYLNIVLFYSDKMLELRISTTLFIGMFFIILASLLNFISQYYKSIIIFNKKFSFIFNVNLFTTFTTFALSYISLLLKINILYSFSLVIVNLLIFLFYQAKVDLVFFNKFIPSNFIYKMVLLLSGFCLFEYYIYTFNFYIIPLNIILLLILMGDLINYLLKITKY